MKKNYFLKIAAMAVLVSFIAASCKTSKIAAVSVTDTKEMPKKIGIPAEIEVSFPCSGIDSDENFIRVNASGKSKDKTMAKDRAYQNALAELSSKLAGIMSMENMKVGVAVNADGEEFHDKMVTISKLIAQANIAGYRTSCEKYTIDQQDGSYNCYVAIDFGKQKMVKEMYEALDKDKLLKADYDFDRYIKLFEKDLKEYENKNR